MTHPTNPAYDDQTYMVEFEVPGALDGLTLSPEIRAPAPNQDPQSIYRPEVPGNLGLIDPDYVVEDGLDRLGTRGNRYIGIVWIDASVPGDGGAVIEVVDAVDSTVLVQETIASLAGLTTYYNKEGFVVPQGSLIRISGFAAGLEPHRVRLFISYLSEKEVVEVQAENSGSVVGSAVSVSDDSVLVVPNVADINFLGDGVTAVDAGGGQVNVNIPGGGGSAGPNFVYQPGGVTTNNVYATWDGLVTALQALEGPKLVEVDDSIVAIPLIPAGVWDVNGATFTGILGNDQTILRGDVGADVNIRRIEGTLQLQNIDPADPLIDLGPAEIFDMADGASIASVGGGAPVIDVAGAGTAIIRLYSSFILNTGDPAVSVSGGAGSNLLIQLWSGSEVDNDAIESVVGTIVTAQMRSSAADFDRDQSGLLGGLVFNYFVPDQEVPVNVGAGGTLPILGFASVTGDPVILPLAITTQGPIYVQNRLSTMLTVQAGVGDSIDAAASIEIPPSAVVTFKSNGLLAWLTYDKSFVEFNAVGMPIPGITEEIDLGDPDNQFRVIHNRLDVRVGPTKIPGFINPPTLIYNPEVIGEISVAVVGYGAGNCVVEALNDVTANIRGRVNNFDAGGTVAALRHDVTVGFVEGGAYMYGGAIGDAAEIDLQGGIGSEIGGYARVAYQEGNAFIRNLAGSGGCRTRAYALVNASSPLGATAIVENSGFNDVFVAAYHEARVYARPGASVFRGSVVGLHAGQYALMENTLDAFACFIHARVQTVAGYNAIARTEDEAGWVTGRTNGGLLETRAGIAAWVRGFAAQGATIYAQGTGSTAWGNAAAGQTIGVAANNSDQWGVGINTLADSSRFGVGWRMKKTTGAPAVPANGDCWIVAGGSMYVHTNGVTKNLDAI